MHELAVTQSILDAVLENAERNHAQRVLSVRLLKGELNDYVDETLQWLFTTLAADTPAAGAELRIETLPIRLRCRDCEKEFNVTRENFEAVCTGCESNNVELIGGREFYLESMEIE